jgi:hypothetical protein
VHEELKRMKRVVFRSLEDRYWYGNAQARDMRDFVYLDILNETEEEGAQVEKVSQYIEETIRKVKEDREVRRKLLKGNRSSRGRRCGPERVDD